MSTPVIMQHLAELRSRLARERRDDDADIVVQAMTTISSMELHRQMYDNTDAPASGEPSGAEARVCPRFGCHARMETRTVCVRCGHYEAESGAEAVAGDVTLDVHDAELLENAADDLEARIHECCDSDDGDAVCHRCGVSMNAVAALRACAGELRRLAAVQPSSPQPQTRTERGESDEDRG